MASQSTPPAGERSQGATSSGRALLLPAALLFGAMFNLTLVVAGLKEFIIDDLGGTIADATLFFSVETAAHIVFAPLWGILSDRQRVRKPFIFTGFAVSALIYSAYGVVDSIPLLLGLRFVQGAFSVMGWSLVMASLLDHPVRGKSGRTMGLMGASLIFGVAVGAPIGGYITRWFGARAPLTVAAILFAVLALASLRLPGGTVTSRHVPLKKILTFLAGRPRLALPYGFHFVDRLAVGLFVVVFPLYIDSLGAADPAIRGRYLSLFLLPFAFLQIFTGRLAERVGPYRPLVIGSFVYGLLLCTVGYADLVELWAVMIGLGIFASVMFPPAILLVARWTDPSTRGSAMGGFNLAGSLGFAIGPLLGGWAYATRGFPFAFVMVGVLEVMLAVVAAFALWRWSRMRAAAGARSDPGAGGDRAGP